MSFSTKRCLYLLQQLRQQISRSPKDSLCNPSNHSKHHGGNGTRREREISGRIQRRGFLEKRSASTSAPLTISTVLVAEMGTNSITLTTPITCKTTQENKTVEIKILLDCGAGGTFMNTTFAKKHGVLLYPLDHPFIPRNVDGTPNLKGKITHYTWIQY
jgi:hypothetical protein